MEQLKTSIEDPRYHSNNRTIFKIDADKLYTGNLRLGNIGCVASGNAKYASNIGVLGLIENIFLYDGKQLISGLRKVNSYMGARLFNKSNSQQRSILSQILQSQLDYSFGDPVEDASGGADDFALTYPIITDEGQSQVATNDATTTSTGFLDLKMVLPFLLNGFLPSYLFKDLQLVIEWSLKNPFQTDPARTVTTILSPVLIMDEIVNVSEKELKMVQSKFERGILFQEIEHDRLVIEPIAPAADETLTQNVKGRLDGFNEKIVSNLIMVNEVTVDADRSIALSSFGSLAQANEIIKLTLNGRALLPYNQIDNPAMKLGLHKDLYGESVCYWGAHSYGLFHTAAQVNAQYAAADKDPVRVLSYLSYGAVPINDLVSRLQVEYERRGIHHLNKTYDAFNLLFFGQVAKAVVYKNGMLETMYVNPKNMAK